jgi:hypothetical protein
MKVCQRESVEGNLEQHLLTCAVNMETLQIRLELFVAFGACLLVSHLSLLIEAGGELLIPSLP